jgi:hypothetical protein
MQTMLVTYTLPSTCRHPCTPDIHGPCPLRLLGIVAILAGNEWLHLRVSVYHRSESVQVLLWHSQLWGWFLREALGRGGRSSWASSSHLNAVLVHPPLPYGGQVQAATSEVVPNAAFADHRNHSPIVHGRP